MNLFARFTALWTKDQDGQIETLKANLAAANDALGTERTRADDAERELRPFQEYVAAADAALPTPLPQTPPQNGTPPPKRPKRGTGRTAR